MKAKASKRAAVRPASKLVLSSVMRCEVPVQLAVPDQLSLGNDGKLYLGRSGGDQKPKSKLQPTSLKESFAWFRVGHECSLKQVYGDSFREWLRMVERALP